MHVMSRTLVMDLGVRYNVHRTVITVKFIIAFSILRDYCDLPAKYDPVDRDNPGMIRSDKDDAGASLSGSLFLRQQK